MASIPCTFYDNVHNTASHLFSTGNEGFNPVLKGTSLQKDAVLAFEAFNPDIGAEPDHLPFIAATRVLFLQADHVAQFYLHHHASSPVPRSLSYQR